MTSRLKRKLNDIGVDPSSSKATENFCLIGTPLPPLEKSKDTGEFVPLWKQEVRDEKGRRRLHGAFTGGFSAGYFNTVGSKEGWTPSTFVSSRGDRAKKKAARPEDFMDEEDLAELRDSQNLVDTSQQADLESGFLGQTVPEDDSIASAVQAALQPPPQDSPGMRILKKMGWRPGHGIGPKVTFEQRKRQEQLSFVAPSLLRGQTISTLDDTDEEAKKHMYPPLNTVVPVLKRKENSHGLGFIPGKGLNEIVASGLDGGAKKGPNISAGFGLGALNDADEDDLDVYDNGMHASSSSRRLAFDDDDDDERIAMGPSRNRNQPTSKVSKGEKYFFKDGRPVLEGFIASDKPVVEDQWFPLPELPKGWTPDPRRVWEKDKENIAGDTISDATAAKTGKGRGKSELTAGERGKLLGETPLPTAPRSVFDYLSPKDRERLKQMAAGATTLPTQPQSRPTNKERSRSPSPGPAPSTQASIPRLDPQAARLALQGFQPFTNDPVKQARYTAFLQAQSQSTETLPFGPFVEQSPGEFRKELEDYVRAAQVFRPVSASMAGRFQSAAVVEVVGNGQEGLRRVGEGKKGEEAENSAETYLTRPKSEEEKEEPLSAKDHAARSGMFGPLTREVKPWQPSRLLCKRFGVKDPNPDMSVDADKHAPAGPSTTTQRLSNAPQWETSELLALANTGTVSTETRSEDAVGASSSSTAKGGRRDISNIGLGEDESQGRDTLTYTRPGRDIFKAIFASDDEDSDDEDEGNGKGKEEVKDLSIAPSETLQAAGGSNVSKTIEAAPPAEAFASSSKSYTPSTSNGTLNDAAGTVDITSFKPTFVPRTERQAEKEKEKEGSGKSKSHKKDKKKKRKTLVSFEVDEDVYGGESLFASRSEDKKSKKKDKDKNRAQDDEDRKKRRKDRHELGEDEEMWVEKPPPEVVKNLESTPADVSLTSEADRSIREGPARGRKRAIDFM